MKKVYVVVPKVGEKEIWIPELEGPNLREVSEFRFFRCKKVTYVWNADERMFFGLKISQIQTN